ncbi:uncharacterized protein LOC141601976 [Silene latifolia]|uniref:uncharacterized protein LOC141601976 n=1 Tax=Silene latifolia TaxID=37657 RepID=UPI003D770CCB
MLGPQMIQDMVDQVHVMQEKMRTAQDRQKSYADLRKSDIEFAVEDKVLLKVSLINYVSEPTHVLEVKMIELDDALTYVETPKEMLDNKVRKTRHGKTVLVKVLWSNHQVEEATWEAVEAM